MAAEALAVTIGSVDSKGKERERGASPLATESVRLVARGRRTFRVLDFWILDVLYGHLLDRRFTSHGECCPRSQPTLGHRADEAFREILVSKNVRHPSARPLPPARPPRALRRPSRHPTRGPIPPLTVPDSSSSSTPAVHATAPPPPPPPRTRAPASPMYIVAHANTINATKAAIHAPAATTRTAVAPPGPPIAPRLCPRAPPPPPPPTLSREPGTEATT